MPSWAKERSIGTRMINARSETLTEKPSFRSAFERRRCPVFADGGYEWRRSGAVKQPCQMSFDDGRPFGMAGLRERWRGPEMGRLPGPRERPGLTVRAVSRRVNDARNQGAGLIE